eukprot:10330-Eustigmatos_ZCMA.PRE.1
MPTSPGQGWFHWRMSNWHTQWDASDVRSKHVTDDSSEATEHRRVKRAIVTRLLLQVLPSAITGYVCVRNIETCL